MKKIFLAIALIALSCLSLKAQNVNVSASAGSSSGSYPTLKDAFAAINSGTHQGNIVLTLVGNTTETGQALLLNGATAPASFTSVRIVPSGARLVQGNFGSVLIDLQGADNVTIDGLNDGANSLTLENQFSSSCAGIGTVRLLGGANNNTLTRCTVLGSVPILSTTSATIICGDGSNNNNTVSFCKVGPSGSNLPAEPILCFSTASNSNFQVLNNEIFDFGSTSGTSAGINLSTNTVSPTVSGNRLYQTASRTIGSSVAGIQFTNASSYATISNNVIGFANAAGTGTSAYITNSGSGSFRGILIGSSTTNAPFSVLQGNTVSGISFRSPRGAGGIPGFVAIDAGTLTNGIAPVTISNNTIGSLDGSSSITVTYTGATTSTSMQPIAGIAYRVATSTGAISNNQVGSITVGTSGANTHYALTGIYLGNSATPNGITVSGNQIGGAPAEAGLRNTMSNSGAAVGIYSSSALNTISGNTIRNINGQAIPGYVVAGMQLVTQSVSTTSDNNIRDISNGQPGTNLASGIYLQSATSSSTGATFQNNSVEAVSVGSGGTIAGLYFANGSGLVKASNNRVHIGRRSDGSTVDGAEARGIWTTTGSSSQFCHNTVLIDGNNSGSNPSYAAFLSGTFTVTNNILYNRRSSNDPAALQAAYLATVSSNIDYNDLLATASTTLAYVGGASYATLADFQAAGYNTHGLSADPLFTSMDGTADLHVRNTALNAGLPMTATVPTDFEGDIRSSSTPTIGADEITCIVPTLSASTLDACGTQPNGSINLTASAGTPYTYSWTGPNGFSAATEDISGIAAGTYTVTVSSGACSATGTYTIASVSQASLAPQPNQVLCAGQSTTDISFAPFNGVVYNWTNSNPSIGLAASGSGDIASFQAENNTPDVIKGTISVLPLSNNGCSFKPMVFTISVKPVPHVNGIEDQAQCAGYLTTPVIFSGNLAGGTYNWYNTNTAIGLAAAGAGNLPSFVAQNNSVTTETAGIIVVPVHLGCSGFPRTFTFRTTPSVASISYGQPAYCQAGSANPHYAGSAGGTWSAAPAGLSINAATGALNLGASTPGIYTVSYTVATINGCNATASTQVTVNPQATVAPAPNQLYCSGVNTAPIAFSGTASTYTWTNDNPSIGLAASGTGDVPSFTTVNAGPGTQYAYIRVTPQGNGSSTCPGKAMAFRISVNFCPPVTQSGNSGGDASVLRSAVTLGPNPAGSSIRLQYAGNARRLTVEVRDAVGRTAIAANSFTGSGITLQTAALLPGTYYAVLSDPATGTQVSLLFVKQ